MKTEFEAKNEIVFRERKNKNKKHTENKRGYPLSLKSNV